MNEGLLTQLLGPEKAKLFMEKGGLYAADIVAQKNLNAEAEAELRELAQAVFKNKSGEKLLRILAEITFFRPSYPPPSGYTAGEYAAYIEGQRKIVAMIDGLTKEVSKNA